MQTITQLFSISATDKRAGILILPDNYDSLIVFTHGKGEAGDGTLATVGSLYNNGSPLAQARDGKLSTVTCPVTGKVYHPAVFAIQGVNQWCVSAADTAFAIKALMKAYPGIGVNGVFATGLSAGGECTLEMVGGPDAALYAAGVPMSTPAPNMAIINWNNLIAKVWAIHGNSDTDPLTTFWNSIQVVNAIDAVKNGSAGLTLVPGEGHDATLWSLWYNPSNRVPVAASWDGGNSITPKTINVYEFWLACKNSKLLFIAATPSPGSSASNTPTSTPVAASATKSIPVVTSNGNIVSFDGSGSTGKIGSSDWYITDSGGKYVNISALGVNPGLLKTSVTLPNGVYNARLTVWDSSGGYSVNSVSFTVSAVAQPTGPTAIATFMYQGIQRTAYSDETWK